MAKRIQSYRDLPLRWNVWGNVVRWELRPRLFLRTSEFLWQEGHTAHATEEDARQYAERVLHEVYADFMVEVLAMPVLEGRKTTRERFPGATNTLACEAMMRDGKALQMGTSHELGQNFARAFDIQYLDAAGEQQHCWTTSWGVSTRMVGGLIMCHGDDRGLRIPPRLAPIQVVVVLVKDSPDARQAADDLTAGLRADGVRVELDDAVDTSFGRRAVDWELKGVPIRLEIGPRDVEAGTVSMVRRDADGREAVPLPSAALRAQDLLDTIQADLLASATARRDEHIHDVTTVDDAVAAAAEGFGRMSWSALRADDGETKLRTQGITVRCLQRPDGSLPASENEAELVAVVSRAY